MNENEKLKLLAETFDMDEGEIKSEDMLAGQEWWDSLSRLSFVVMLEEHFGKKISGEEIKGFTSVKDLLDRMNK